MIIKEAVNSEEIKLCYPVIKQLRPHIKTEEELIERVKDRIIPEAISLSILR